MSFNLSAALLSLQRNALIFLCLIGLLLAAITDFLTDSPGDATLLLTAFAASAVGVLILWPHPALKPHVERLAPRSSDGRLAAFGLFAFSATAVFSKIAEDVVELESSQLDRAASLWVHRFDTPTLDFVMQKITALGDFSIIVFPAVGLLIWCWRRRDIPAFAGLVGVIAADELLKFTLKDVFGRPRPSLFPNIPPLHSYSFPSGHSMASVAIWGMFAVVIGRLMPRAKPFVYWGIGILALLIGYSRVYLGAHWLTDVLGGYAVGAAILAVGIAWLEAHPPAEETRT